MDLPKGPLPSPLGADSFSNLLGFSNFFGSTPTGASSAISFWANSPAAGAPSVSATSTPAQLPVSSLLGTRAGSPQASGAPPRKAPRLDTGASTSAASSSYPGSGTAASVPNLSSSSLGTTGASPLASPISGGGSGFRSKRPGPLDISISSTGSNTSSTTTGATVPSSTMAPPPPPNHPSVSTATSLVTPATAALAPTGPATAISPSAARSSGVVTPLDAEVAERAEELLERVKPKEQETAKLIALIDDDDNGANPNKHGVRWTNKALREFEFTDGNSDFDPRRRNEFWDVAWGSSGTTASSRNRSLRRIAEKKRNNNNRYVVKPSPPLGHVLRDINALELLLTSPHFRTLYDDYPERLYGIAQAVTTRILDYAITQTDFNPAFANTPASAVPNQPHHAPAQGSNIMTHQASLAAAEALVSAGNPVLSVGGGAPPPLMSPRTASIYHLNSFLSMFRLRVHVHGALDATLAELIRSNPSLDEGQSLTECDLVVLRLGPRADPVPADSLLPWLGALETESWVVVRPEVAQAAIDAASGKLVKEEAAQKELLAPVLNGIVDVMKTLTHTAHFVHRRILRPQPESTLTHEQFFAIKDVASGNSLGVGQPFEAGRRVSVLLHTPASIRVPLYYTLIQFNEDCTITLPMFVNHCLRPDESYESDSFPVTTSANFPFHPNMDNKGVVAWTVIASPTQIRFNEFLAPIFLRNPPAPPQDAPPQIWGAQHIWIVLCG